MIDPNGTSGERLTLVNLLARAEISQRDLARALGVREATISDWKTKGIIPNLPPSQFWLLKKALRATDEELIEAFEGPAVLDSLLSAGYTNGLKH